MKGFFRGLVFKLSLIAVGFVAIVLTNGTEKRFEGLVGQELLSQASGFGQSLQNMVEGLSTEEMELVRPANAAVAPEFKITLAEPLKAPEVPEACLKADASGDRVVIGDTVRLRFFEAATAPATQGGTGPETVASKIAYERLDLSGNYGVSQDGAISVPMIGRVDVAGLAIGCLEPIVAKAAFDFSPADMRVSAGFASRPAVVAQGDLRAPGRYDYVPGMTVAQLLTIAGAPNDGATRVAAANEPYLAARQNELERAVMSNFVKWHRVSAAIDGKDSLELNDAQLRAAQEILGTKRIEAEMAALTADTRLRRATTSQMEVEYQKVKQLIEQKRKHVQLIEWQVRKVVERHVYLTKLQEKGVVKMETVSDVDASKMAVERLLLETQSQLIELQAREVELASAVDLQRLKDEQALAMELRSISEEGDGLEGQLVAVNQQLGLVPGVEGQETYVAVMIDRADTHQARRFEAGPGTLILPGDVVTSTIKTRDVSEDMARSILEGGILSKRTRDE